MTFSHGKICRIFPANRNMKMIVISFQCWIEKSSSIRENSPQKEAWDLRCDFRSNFQCKLNIVNLLKLAYNIKYNLNRNFNARMRYLKIEMQHILL